MDVESIANEIYDQEEMELFTGITYVLATQSYDLELYAEFPSGFNAELDDYAWLMIWNVLDMASIVERTDVIGPIDKVSYMNPGQIGSIAMKYSMNKIIPAIDSMTNSTNITSEWLSQFMCCYDGQYDTRV